jgi:hypothetical protein
MDGLREQERSLPPLRQAPGIAALAPGTLVDGSAAFGESSLMGRTVRFRASTGVVVASS